MWSNIFRPLVYRWYLEAPMFLGGWQGTDIRTICSSHYPTLAPLWSESVGAVNVCTEAISTYISSFSIVFETATYVTFSYFFIRYIFSLSCKKYTKQLLRNKKQQHNRILVIATITDKHKNYDTVEKELKEKLKSTQNV
jgi:hypothetical protein